MLSLKVVVLSVFIVGLWMMITICFTKTVYICVYILRFITCLDVV
ncbi:hypothetical protein HanPI659440_Chr12g0455091 [Helianthus annuus]|nr:hypothetical protein HanPI659440_Chr12g0455091 [Helianthus annuus]